MARNEHINEYMSKMNEIACEKGTQDMHNAFVFRKEQDGTMSVFHHANEDVEECKICYL